jgi:hypothetical protein
MRVMMLAISIALGVPACLFSDHSPPPDSSCPDGAASCSDNPYVHFLAPGRLAAGAEITLRYLANPMLDTYEITSSDPSIMAVERDVPDRSSPSVALHSLAAGTVTITARVPGTTRVLDAIDLTAVDVAAIEVRFRTAPIAAQPITAIAGLVSTADHLNIDYRSSTGEKLGGHGTVTVSGGDAIAIVAVGTTPSLVSEAFENHDSIGVRFTHLGTATLAIGLRDRDPKVALPIEVVAAPAKLDVVAMVLRDGALAVAPQPTMAGEYIGTDAIGHTSDGRFVAGVTATWSAVPSVSFLFLTPPITTTPEVVFYAPPAGPLTVTATTGSLQATAQLTSQ